MTSQGDRPMSLAALHLRADVHAAVSVVELLQVYRNDDVADIEATYTFPLASDAILLGLDLTLGGRRMNGTVVPRREAETRYEEAIASGDTPIRVSQARDGLYVAELGNLRPGDQAEIRLRYARLHEWDDDALRLAFPTTIAPRYGDAREAGLAPHETPVIDALSEQDYSIEVRLHGSLADADISSPTHAVKIAKDGTVPTVCFARETAVADRDCCRAFKVDQVFGVLLAEN
jgi:Ca-activated chloride channel family protein